jgi:hypothetical protein
MARTTPVHSGYIIINGATTGTSAYKADTWVEYLVVEQSIPNNQSRIIAYFYTALADGESSGTYDNQSGRDCTELTINGASGTKYTGQPYNYKVSTPMLLGVFDGWVTHNADGTKTIAITGKYTISSPYISGGNLSANIALPAISRGLMRPNISGTFYTGLVYVNVGGTWALGIAYVNSNGTWMIGI